MLLITVDTYAQKLELTPIYGYQLGAKLNYRGGFVRLDDGDQYGVALGVNLPQRGHCGVLLVKTGYGHDDQGQYCCSI